MRRLSALLLTALVGLAAPACGEGQQSAQEIVAGSADNTEKAGTSKLALTVTTKVGDQTVNVVGEGSIDYVRERGRLTMDLSALGVPGASGTMEMLLMGKVIFMKLPPQGLPAALVAKPWVRLDVEKLSQKQGFSLGNVDQLRNNDPTNTLDYLRGASDDVTEVGEEKVRGEDTTHYKATLDLKEAAEEQPEAKEALDQAVEQLGTSTVPVEVWIDGEGRLRRMRYEMDLSKSPQAQQSGQQGGNVRMEMELYDFGTKVDVTEPPADQVTDFEELLGGGM